VTVTRRAFIALALIVAAGMPLVAKGNAVTVRIAIAGSPSTNVVTVTDESILARSNVYAGLFLGPVTTRSIDPAWPRYVITLVVEPRTPMPALAPTGVFKPYLMHYAINPATGERFLYLPGRGEDGYRLNTNLIIRQDGDGRWHRADPTWAGLLNGYLPRG
jgi:hypothetical protein